MKINKIAGALALVAGLTAISSTALADTYYDVGPLTPGIINSTPAFNPIPGGPFTDTFKFNLTSASDVSLSLNDFPVSLFSFTLLKNENIFLSLNNETIGTGQSMTVHNLATGIYYAVVTGNATGSGWNGLSGLYSVSMLAQPVPVPAAAWLLGSGLIGLVAVGRRKEPA